MVCGCVEEGEEMTTKRKGGNPPRNKGYSYEREVVNIAKDAGHKAQRTPTSKYPDVRIDNEPVSCKRRKNGMEWAYKELETHSYVLFRADNKPSLKIKLWKP